MADVTGVAFSNELVQLHATALVRKGEKPNTFAKRIAAKGVRIEGSIEFPDAAEFALAEPSQPSIAEDASPVVSQVNPTGTKQVIQIFSYGIGSTYLAQSDVRTASGINLLASGDIVNARDEALQMGLKELQFQDDFNYSCLLGVYNKPADPTAGNYQMRGLNAHITTHRVDMADDQGGLTKATFEAALKAGVEAKSWTPETELDLYAGIGVIATLSAAYVSSTQPPMDREVAGFRIKTIVTPFGLVNLMYEPSIPSTNAIIAQTALCQAVALPVPGKGVLFVEDVPDTKTQSVKRLYGQWSCAFGSEWRHMALENIGLATAA